MSRLGFRYAVALPRPRSAVAMVALATLTLAITGQIEPWVLVLSAGTLIFAARPGRPPAPWQHSAVFLNLGLAFTVGTGAVLWWRGELAILALAHFAMLTQGLQLLDTRPRRSEFLLVALSVFQVTMAANLTDSAFFPPLLVAFTIATVWTLIIHTLRAEAIECGEPAAAHRVLSKGLLRTTLVASLVSVLLSAALFPILPRIRTGAIFDKGFGPPLSVAGFSDRVELGDIGRIRQDPGIVLRVETEEGPVLPAEERYWRGIAFDHFDGRRWSVTPKKRDRVLGNPEIGVDLGGSREGTHVVQHIIREDVNPGVLFSPGLPAGMRGGVGRVERDVNGSLYAHATADKRVLYVISSFVRHPGPERLADDRTSLPFPHGERYLQLPELRPEIAALARTITADAETDGQRLAALERWLRTRGRYTDSPPDFGTDRSPVEGFLLDRTEGHCEYFASSMVVLARSLGIPARIVNGFAAGAENSVGGFIEVAQSDAHTWVEVHYREAGWVRYDPTPPDLRMAGSDALRDGRTWRELASAIELWWFTNVVDFDRGTQTRALKDLWMSWNEWRQERREAQGSGGGGRTQDREEGSPFVGPAPWGLGIAALFVLLAAADLRRRRRTVRLPADYATALRWLARRGHRRAPGQTARAFSRQLARAIPEEAARAFARVTEAYLGQRFGAREAVNCRDELAVMRQHLRA